MGVTARAVLDGHRSQGGGAVVGNADFWGDVAGALAANGSLDGVDARIQVTHRITTERVDQRSTLAQQGRPHAVLLALAEHVAAGFAGVVEVVLYLLGAVTCRAGARNTQRSGRRVAYAVALGFAVGFLVAGVGVVEGVVESEAVAHLVGERAVHVGVGLEVTHGAKGVVQDNNAVVGVVGGEVGVPLDAA